MPLGIAVEEPITSYFRRVSATRNHKQNQLIRSTAKRKRTQTSQAEDPIERPKTRQKLTLTDASRNRNGASQPKTPLANLRKEPSAVGQPASHAFRQSSSTSPSIDSQSPITTRQSTGGSFNRQNYSGEDRRKQCDSLQTPPPTIRPSKKRPAATGCARPIPLHAASRHSSGIVSLPTPATIPRPITSGHGRREPVLLNFAPLPSPSNSIDSHPAQFHSLMSTGGGRKSGGSRQSKRGLVHEDLFADPSASQMLVLSSQTQHVDLLPPDIQSLQPLPKTPPLPSILSPPRSLSHGSPSVGATNDDDFIHSSQSQHVLPHYISPRRNCANKTLLDTLHPPVDQSTCEEVVASSQSQIENELNMSMRSLDHTPYEQLVIGAGLLKTFSNQNRSPSASPLTCSSLPHRTLSDELFPVPIQSMTFLDEDLPDSRVNTPVDRTDSTTESEDESESENESSNRRMDTTLAAFTRDCALASTTAGVSGAEALQDTAEYINSLPSTVQDFEFMFDEGSESI